MATNKKYVKPCISIVEIRNSRMLPLEEIRSILIDYEINNLESNEKKPVFEMITPEESLGIDSDTYNKIVDECLYGEQKPADKVEPKFKQGDIIKEKETGNLFYVNSVEEFGYTLHYKNCIAKGCTMDFKYEDNYELVEQKPAWSEEDEKMFNSALWHIKNSCGNCGKNSGEFEVYNWLKSLKERYTWKPSELQIEALESATENCAYSEYQNCLRELAGQLKKLMER